MACTVGDRIFVNRSTYRHGSAPGCHLLAHELAHVVQKRRRGRNQTGSAQAPPPRWRVESEAAAAAAAVAGGGCFTCVLADEPDRPRFWGPLGHYYTVYFVMLSAGVQDDLAHELAYYTQIPDLVSELDAKWLAIHAAADDDDTAQIADDLGVERTQVMLLLRHYKFDPAQFSKELDQEMKLRRRMAGIPLSLLGRRGIARMVAQRYPTLEEIQAGLHCLTGGSSKLELEKRTALMKQAAMALSKLAPSAKLDFGLATHAYGDAFAHRRQDDPATMYGTGKGHAVDSIFGDSPDDITNKNRADIYLEYAQGFFDIVKQQNVDAQTNRAKDKESLDRNLRTILQLEKDAPGEESDGLWFRAIARKHLNVTMHAYRPQDTAMWWSRYDGSSDRLTSEVPLSESDIRRAFILAKQWTAWHP
jgi:hypothetical protein